MSFSALNPARFPFYLWLALLFNGFDAHAQPAEMKWYPTVRSAKDQRTLALLKAGPDGFYLLRWQESRTDAAGQKTPALPLLTVLTPSGDRLHDDPLPGFEDGQLDFRFALSNDSLALVAYEAPGGTGQTLYVRRLQLSTRKWSGAPQALFTKNTNRSPAFPSAWFSRSADGGHWCIYAFQSGSASADASVAVFDAGFQLKWQRQAPLPPQSGPTWLRQALCTHEGSVLVHAQVFNPEAPIGALAYETAPSAYRTDGRALYRNNEMAAEAPAYSNALFLLHPETADVDAFYPKIGKKFTPSFELSENADGKVYAAGFTNDAHNHAADGYFVYQIDLKTRQGQILQNAPLPASVRKAFLPARAAEKKEPVEDLMLRRLDWAGDGRPWLLVERQNFAVPPGRIESAALLRLDSTYRITAARKVDKYQLLPSGDPQNFAAAAACPAPKGGWWLLWNEGRWPDTKLMLSECRPNGEPEHFQLDAAARSNVTLLPQTVTQQAGKWYFVGESEYHERLRIGEMERSK